MPVVVDNNFARDTHGIRAERLNAIQGNFDSIQSVLQAPANIEDWSEECYDIYSQLLAESGVEAGESEGATLDATTKGDLMEFEYQNTRTLGNALYVNNPVKLKDFGFEMAFPDNRNDKIARVDRVLDANTRHIADGVTPLLPASIITRLSDAKEDYVDALKGQDKERADARQAVADLSKRFESDTKMLQTLRAWWYAMLGKQDARIDLIGMVNPQTGGNSGPKPAAPFNLVYNAVVPNISWAPVPGATSYELQVRDADPIGDWETVYTGVDTVILHSDSAGEWNARARARNENGYGDWSAILEYEVIGGGA